MPVTKKNKPDFSKSERIEKELTRISKIFEKADGNDRIIIFPLLQNAAFMKVTLEDLQEIINAEGVTEEYQNGANQRGIKQSATLQSYNALIKNYTSVVKALMQYVPSEVRKSDVSDLRSWLDRKVDEETEEERKQRMEEDHERFMENIRQLREKYPDS